MEIKFFNNDMWHHIFPLNDVQFHNNILDFLIEHKIKTSALNIKERSGNNSLYLYSENLRWLSNIGQVHHTLNTLSPLHEIQGTSCDSDVWNRASCPWLYLQFLSQSMLWSRTLPALSGLLVAGQASWQPSPACPCASPVMQTRALSVRTIP